MYEYIIQWRYHTLIYWKVLEYIDNDVVEVNKEKDQEEDTYYMRTPTDAHMTWKWDALEATNVMKT